MGKSVQITLNTLDDVFNAIRIVVKRYNQLTGRKLNNITGDLGEYLACQLLNWQIADEQQAGYDAINLNVKGKGTFLNI